MASLIEVTVPDIGDFKNIPVIEVFVKPGDTVKAEDSLMTLESDKATMDVPSPAAGVVKEIVIKTGDRVSKGTRVLMLEPANVTTVTTAPAAAPVAAPSAPAPAVQPAPSKPMPAVQAASAPQPAASAPINDAAHRAAHASPSVRQFARELGVDLSRVKGTGPKDRILREDVQAYVDRKSTRLNSSHSSVSRMPSSA